MRRLADLGASWRETLLEEAWASVPRAWAPAYDADARFMIDQALSRLGDAMTDRGRLSAADSPYDGTLSFERVPIALVEGRGDFRYRSDRLSAWLEANPSLDLVPIVCSRTRSGYRVLDGHHRLRAYAAIGRAPLAVVIGMRPGAGRVSLP